jgi:hypothetical protein
MVKALEFFSVNITNSLLYFVLGQIEELFFVSFGGVDINSANYSSGVA